MSDNSLSIRDAESLVLEVNTDTPREQVVQAIDRIDFLKRTARELDQQLKAALIEWIDANGEITIGESRYYVGSKKAVKCRDAEQTLEALMTATGGDFAKVCDCLTSNAWKHGAARGVLDDAEFERCFHTVVQKEAKTGRAVREVKQINERFVR